MNYNEDDVREARGYGWNRAPWDRQPSNGDAEFNRRHERIRRADGGKPSAWLVDMLRFFGW